MNTVNGWIADVDWGAPSVGLAVAVSLLFILFSTKKKRFTTMWLLSAAGAGAGFLLGGWVGVATVCAAAAYRLFQPLRAPWQAIITVTATVAGFAAATWAVQTADPHAAAERSAGTVTGIPGDIVASIDKVAGNRTLLYVCLVGGLLLTGYTYWRMRQRQRSPYRGLGRGINPNRMYRGIANPNMEVLPDDRRDPKRVFTAKERKDKLEEQGGLCAYQKPVRAHPSWEPYRSGVQWEGDHIVPHAMGGATSPANLQILCADCNSAKSSKFGPAALKAVEQRWRTR